ncbi:MAG: L,D-transpeptidase family protein [Syntrophales bacterium]|nr:L,D-transpeptidase family protein [Syntrophales bacterium]
MDNLKRGIFPVILLLLLFLSPPPACSFFTSTAVPDSIVYLSTGTVVVVDKQAQKLYVFQRNNGGNIVRVFEAPCSTGKKTGAKQESGDAKTPNGIFFATRFFQDRELSSVYGSMAFHLDFPNLHDRRAGRNGSNIWIHGTNKPLQPFQSNGCVVLRNRDIERLAGYICLWKTPVIIQESVHWTSPGQKSPDREELERVLFAWDRGLNEGDMQLLESLYMSDSRDRKERRAMVQRSSNLRSLAPHFVMSPRDISILKLDGRALILFDKVFSFRNDSTFQGSYVKLFLERNADRWYIVEDLPPQMIAAKAVREQKETKDEGQAAAAREPEASGDAAIRKVLDKWVQSWQTGDMKEYRACYSPDFRSRGMNLDAWVAYKTDLARRYKRISVRITNVRISAGPQQATVTFRQKYSAQGGLKSTGTKKLELRKIKDSWKIHRELMG